MLHVHVLEPKLYTALVKYALAPEFHDPVVECMHASPVFQETTDINIAVEKQACLMVQYFDDGVASVVTKCYIQNGNSEYCHCTESA